MSVSKEILKNNLNALKELYRYKSDFLGFVRKNFGISTEQGNDIFQESVVLFYINVLKNKEEIRNEKTYLFEIGKNLARNDSRKKARQFEFPMEEKFYAIVDEEYEPEFTELQINKVVQLLDLIGDNCVQILKKFYFLKLSMEEIMKDLEYKNTDTVKTKKYKCVQQLKKLYFKAN